ncbi:hypothetical protein SAMN04488511_103310 [Pedobacter suwonensis]|uniref:Uncharacterized protein n=1 Tax=Pedobacter suwonensis TaxID=332999 RepID=A0A1I0SUU5_9SPHI|nr:hypothetical protein SAMN04488511_103310 [Pedobacter suwonensis]
MSPKGSFLLASKGNTKSPLKIYSFFDLVFIGIHNGFAILLKPVAQLVQWSPKIYQTGFK